MEASLKVSGEQKMKIWLNKTLIIFVITSQVKSMDKQSLNIKTINHKNQDNKYQTYLIGMEDNQFPERHKHLDFTYSDFEKRKKNLENWKLDKYYVFQQIGEGSFAQIYRGMNGETRKQVAIKVLDIRSVEKSASTKIKAIRKRLIQEESKLMMKIDCTNVLKCFECFQNKDIKIMMIQFCNQGSLMDKIELSKKIPEDEAISMLKQIFKGIGQCHRRKIIHRDLKPENILIHNGEMKIADFGFSKKLSINNQNELTQNTMLGTPTTMAPQVLANLPYGLKADIWSIGIIFFWMIFGVCPFKLNSSNKEILEAINIGFTYEEYNGVRPSLKVKKFLQQILVIDLQKRLGWRQILNHEIFVEDSKILPNSFYRQTQMKKDDQELFQIQREFMKRNSSAIDSIKSSKLQESVNDIESPKKQTPNSNKEEGSRESLSRSQIQLKQESQVLKNRKITSEFESSQSPSKQARTRKQQEKNHSLKDEEMVNDEDERFSLFVDHDKKPQTSNRQSNPPLPPRQYLQKDQNTEKYPAFSSISDQKERQNPREKKKPVYKSLKQEQPHRLSSKRKLRSPSIQKKQISPRKPQQKISQQMIEKRVQTIQKPLPPLPQFPRDLERKYLPNQKARPQPVSPIMHKNTNEVKPELIKQTEISKPEIKIPKIEEKPPIKKRQSNQSNSMTPSEITDVKQLINRQEDELYAWAMKTHVECLKTQIIFNKIIKVIQNFNMLKIDDRKVIETMYLLCARCRNNISPIYSEYEKRKHSSVLKQISGLVERLYKQVTEKYFYYSGLLTKKENQKVSIVKDWFSKKLFTEDFKKKDIFLTGVESMAEFRSSIEIQMSRHEPQEKQEGILKDYNKQDQIKNTSLYVREMIKSLTHHSKAKQVLPYMIHFEEICQIKVNDCTIYNFKETVEYIIRDQTYRERNFN